MRREKLLDVANAPDIVRGDLVSEAAHNLQNIFKELAPAEALTRALVSQRSENPEMARFWVEVFGLCGSDNGPSADQGGPHRLYERL